MLVAAGHMVAVLFDELQQAIRLWSVVNSVGFVVEGMPAMMNGMVGNGMVGGMRS